MIACSCASWPLGVSALPPPGVAAQVYLSDGARGTARLLGRSPCLLPLRIPFGVFGSKMSGNTETCIKIKLKNSETLFLCRFPLIATDPVNCSLHLTFSRLLGYKKLCFVFREMCSRQFCS